MNAQQVKVDSLIKIIRTSNNDTIILKTRNALIDIYINTSDYDLAISSCNENEELANKILAANVSGILKKTTIYQLGYTISSKGACYMRKGDNAQALELFIKSSELLQAFSNKKEYVKALNNIGVVLFNLHELEKALTYFEKAVALSEEAGSKVGMIRGLMNMGNIYNDLHDHKKAIVYLNQSLKLAETENVKGGIAGSLGNLGMSYILLKDYDKARSYYFRCLKVSEESGEKQSIARCYNKIGEAYHADNQLKESLKYELMAYNLAEQIGVLEIKKRAADDLAVIYDKLNEPANAYKYYKIFIACRDSMLNLEQAKTVLQKEMQFEFDKKESVNKILQEKKDALSEKEKQRQKLVRNYLIVGCIFVTLMVIVVYRSFRQKAKANDIISHQKKEVESQKELLEEKNKEITDSINYAKRIQLTLLANQNLLKENIKDYFILFEPKDIVSGDFYWASKRNDNFYMAVCDSTGHGVPGAFMSLLNMSFLNESIAEKNLTLPNEILNHVRKRLIENISHGGAQDGMDAIVMCFNETSMKLTYSAANNSSIIIRGKEIISLESDRMPVGKGERTDSFNLKSIDLQKNDVIYMYTDGYADQFGGARGKKLKYKKLNEILLSNCDLPMNEQYAILLKEFVEWKGSLEQVDDVCIIGIRL